MWDGMDELDPAWADEYMSAVIEPYESGVLTPKTVQLLCIAVDASCTHLFAPGVRRHIRAALDMGVTPEEIFEVLKLCTTVGIHSMNVGLPILREEAGRTHS
ncbi:carboxymuconolactone decarboxylase family protein [Tomitella fengzijianii]|uniref:Carboxymuconolactone decarboxylase family protein n=1 Tax=Tomitella fengzijianii TaxID=2597660 RepID=A0A516X7Z4_9ACTN|nr:carboxymuconolactone decarboxylase family protein [Tomitella fengzijianii]